MLAQILRAEQKDDIVKRDLEDRVNQICQVLHVNSYKLESITSIIYWGVTTLAGTTLTE